MHEVQAVLGVVTEPAQRRAPLAGVTGVAVAAASNDNAFVIHLDALAKGLSQWYEWRNSRAAHGVAAGAAIGHHIVAEESAAVIDDCLVPLQLVETFDGEIGSASCRERVCTYV